MLRVTPQSLFTAHLRKCLDVMREAYDIVKVSATRSACANFVAATTRLLLAIERVNAANPPTSSGGRLEAPAEEKKIDAQSAVA